MVSVVMVAEMRATAVPMVAVAMGEVRTAVEAPVAEASEEAILAATLAHALAPVVQLLSVAAPAAASAQAGSRAATRGDPPRGPGDFVFPRSATPPLDPLDSDVDNALFNLAGTLRTVDG